ncbi:MAG: hypothetical protein ACE5MM_07230, partial [Nitrospiraceae bacterium]
VDDVSEIKRITQMLQEQNRAIDALQEQNRALAKRIAELEAAQHAGAQKQEEAENQPGKVETESSDQKQLEKRVEELEAEKAAQEAVTRSIIRQALSTLGSKINESVTFGGTLELLTGAAQVFEGRSERVLRLITAELDFEIQVTDWASASIIIEYDDGTGVVFPTTEGFETSVDRINLDTAWVTIGDPQRFPPFLNAGRIIVPFGISTGDPVADVLTIVDPLTIEVFETKEDTVLIGVAFPTPAPTPATPPVFPPPVRPLVINPLVSLLMRGVGYDAPPTRPPPPTPLIPTPAPPLFNAGLFLYNGDTLQGTGNWEFTDNFGATLGFRTKGNCGRPYDQLGAEGRWWEVFCPWTVDVDVDFNNSVFDSDFLTAEYQSFLRQIGFVPGMAGSVKANLGPVSLVGEWNGAISQAKFADELGTAVSIKPSAWQVSLGYQFDWNPWVEAIGAQGTYFAISYSESYDLAGVTRVLGGVRTRVGAVPRRRFSVGGGEWILDNLKWAIEFTYNQDYSQSENGTGRDAYGLFSKLTYVW